MSTIFNVEEIERNCEEFFALYDIQKSNRQDMIQAKVIHTHEVAANSLQIAKSHGLSQYECVLAWIIGELHDFARFGQIRVTGNFRDSDKYNHAKFGAKLLFKYRIIEDIVFNWDEVSTEDKLVVEKAIYHHSDFKLPDNLTKRERLFCEIIREADQIDIFRTIATSDWKTIYGHTKDEILESDISEEILAAFPRQELANYSKRVTYADYHLAHIAISFGLKSAAAKKRVKDQGYLYQMMDIEFKKPEIQKKYEYAKMYVEEFLRGA